MNKIKTWIKLLRVYQWTKSSFIVLPAVFSGHIFVEHGSGVFRFDLVWEITKTVFFFSLMASSVYIFNDIKDLELDRADQVKRKRPLASGAVPIGVAVAVGFSLLGIVAAWLIITGQYALGSVFLVYLFINGIYNLVGKRIIIIDVFIISVLFVVRVVAGTVLIQEEPSPWLFACTFFLALFLAFSKRLFEVLSGPPEQYIGGSYSVDFLNPVITMTSTMALLSYSLYTLQPKWEHSYMYCTIPLVALGIFRYLFILYQSEMEDKNPSSVLIKDPIMLTVVNLWLIVAVWIYFYFPPQITSN